MLVLGETWVIGTDVFRGFSQTPGKHYDGTVQLIRVLHWMCIRFLAHT